MFLLALRSLTAIVPLFYARQPFYWCHAEVWTMSLPFSPASSLTAMERFCFSECCYYIGLNIFLSCIFTMCIVDPFLKK